MSEIEIMEFIYNNQKDSIWVNLNDFFIEKFPNAEDQSLYKHISDLLSRLDKNEFVSFSDKEYQHLGKLIPPFPPIFPSQNSILFSFEEMKRRREIKKENGENFGIMAQLRYKGEKEVENWRFQKKVEDVNQSVIDTNNNINNNFTIQKNLTKASIIIALGSAIFVLASVYLNYKDTTSLELRRIDTTLQKQEQILQDLKQYQKNVEKKDSPKK